MWSVLELEGNKNIERYAMSVMYYDSVINLLVCVQICVALRVYICRPVINFDGFRL